MTEPKETFYFDNALKLKGKWLLGLSHITEETKKISLFTKDHWTDPVTMKKKLIITKGVKKSRITCKWN